MTKDVFAQLLLTPKEHQEPRINMLKQQIRTWDVHDKKILTLVYSIPREAFVPAEYKSLAFADMRIPLSNDQSMMTPREEARVLQELDVEPSSKILVLGTDSGFMVTLLSHLGKQVYYVDNDINQLEHVTDKVKQFGKDNVNFNIGNLDQGWHDFRPFDIILMTGSMPFIPESLKNALAVEGRLFVVVGYHPAMEAFLVTRLSEHSWSDRKLFETERPRMRDVKELENFSF